MLCVLMLQTQTIHAIPVEFIAYFRRCQNRREKKSETLRRMKNRDFVNFTNMFRSMNHSTTNKPKKASLMIKQNFPGLCGNSNTHLKIIITSQTMMTWRALRIATARSLLTRFYDTQKETKTHLRCPSYHISPTIFNYSHSFPIYFPPSFIPSFPPFFPLSLLPFIHLSFSTS